MSEFEKIQELLRRKAELTARLNLIAYQGTVEIKTVSGEKYLYVRKRELGKLKSSYVGKYSDELYGVLLRDVKESKELKKEIRKIENRLAELNYFSGELPFEIAKNLDFARANMKLTVYEQAVLEGCATTFPDTETILDNGKVNNVSATDVQKILNLKHAWEFVLDKDVLTSKTDFYVLSYISRLVNEGFYMDGGRVRAVPVQIGGSSYRPTIPVEIDVKESISKITESGLSVIDTAVELMLFVMKTQVFNDGNKRSAVIFANHYLISHAGGMLVVPEGQVPFFKKLLVEYYEGENENIKPFLKETCWKKLN